MQAVLPDEVLPVTAKSNLDLRMSDGEFYCLGLATLTRSTAGFTLPTDIRADL
ncbi:MAG TPA: hypothetical protein VH639_11720 [Bryobacteraceae bacterium]|jgi:hypothetical protein